MKIWDLRCKICFSHTHILPVAVHLHSGVCTFTFRSVLYLHGSVCSVHWALYKVFWVSSFLMHFAFGTISNLPNTVISPIQWFRCALAVMIFGLILKRFVAHYLFADRPPHAPHPRNKLDRQWYWVVWCIHFTTFYHFKLTREHFTPKLEWSIFYCWNAILLISLLQLLVRHMSLRSHFINLAVQVRQMEVSTAEAIKRQVSIK